LCGGFAEVLIDYREQLVEVNEAIIALLQHGQSFTVGDKHYTRANLGELMELQQKLIGLVATQLATKTSSGGVRYGRPLDC
jgi:hypothetical protein